MPDSVLGEQRRDARESSASGELGTLLLAEEAAGAIVRRGARGLPAPSLEARVGQLHARYRLGLEAKRAGPVPRLLSGHDHHAIALLSMLARLARLTGLGGASDGKPPQVLSNTIVLPQLPRTLDGLTLAHLSDLHLGLRSLALGTALGAALASRASDALIITGDLFSGALTPPGADGALRGLEKILTAHGGPAFAVLGDQDSLWMVPRMERLGLRVLVNESVALNHGADRLYLAGVDDPAYFKADDLEAALQCIPAGATSVLLAHSPDIYRRAASAGFDAMLCGHTHGGQICLPTGHPLLRACNAPSDMFRGRWRYQHLVGYTSAGSASTPLKLRWNCPAEVTFHRFAIACGEDQQPTA